MGREQQLDLGTRIDPVDGLVGLGRVVLSAEHTDAREQRHGLGHTGLRETHEDSDPHDVSLGLFDAARPPGVPRDLATAPGAEAIEVLGVVVRDAVGQLTKTI